LEPSPASSVPFFSQIGEVRNVSLLVAIGVNERGYREILGICGGGEGG
jgi:transposase-like protein